MIFIDFNVYLRKIALQEVGVRGIIFKRELQIKRNNAFDSWKVSGFTCIERALNGLFDIQDAKWLNIEGNRSIRTRYTTNACHDKGSIYEYLSFQNHRHLISSKFTYNSTNILYQHV
jgi:hypothetical protein